MDLKSTIKRILDEQVDILTNPGVVDPELRITPTKPKSDNTTPKSDNTTSDSKKTEKIDVGYVDIPQILIDAYGIELVKSVYESQGFEVTDDNKVTGWGLPLEKKYMVTPIPERKYGAPRPVNCTSNCRDHEGVDYAAPNGTPIYATKGGKVIDSHMLTQQEIDAGNHCGPGQLIIQSGNYTIIHCHLTKLDVSKGQDVVIGQKIGEVGEGHLHIEIDKNGDKKGIDNWSQIYSQLV